MKAAQGRIELICGSMFSGKTEELLRRFRRAQIARQRTVLIKPSVDTRFGTNTVQTHDELSYEGIAISSPSEILDIMKNFDVCAIDEAQFFDHTLPNICTQLANSGKRVILAGLDMDAFGQPFGPIPQLLCVAEEVLKLQAVCALCGSPAHFTKRLSDSDELLMLGAKEHYEPRCRSCYPKTERPE